MQVHLHPLLAQIVVCVTIHVHGSAGWEMIIALPQQFANAFTTTPGKNVNANTSNNFGFSFKKHALGLQLIFRFR
jgi:hypothetical protein